MSYFIYYNIFKIIDILETNATIVHKLYRLYIFKIMTNIDPPTVSTMANVDDHTDAFDNPVILPSSIDNGWSSSDSGLNILANLYFGL